MFRKYIYKQKLDFVISKNKKMRHKLNENEKKIKTKLRINKKLNEILEKHLNGINKSKFIEGLIIDELKNKKQLMKTSSFLISDIDRFKNHIDIIGNYSIIYKNGISMNSNISHSKCETYNIIYYSNDILEKILLETLSKNINEKRLEECINLWTFKANYRNGEYAFIILNKKDLSTINIKENDSHFFHYEIFTHDFENIPPIIGINCCFGYEIINNENNQILSIRIDLNNCFKLI